MKSGQHAGLPKAELAQFEADLRLQAKADGVDIDIKAKDNADGTVDVAWTVSQPKAAASGPVAAATEALGQAASVAAAHPAATAAVAGAAIAGAAAAAFVLGKLSEKFEVGKRGPGTVSGGQGDPGGVSYGSYQMTSRRNGGTVARFVGEPGFAFADRFKGLTPGTPEFSDAWRALAQEQPDAFKAAQHEFIKRTHFDPMVQGLRVVPLDVLARSEALQDCIWSTAVQHGPHSDIPLGACRTLLAAGSPKPGDGEAFDEALIRLIYAERGRKDAAGVLVHFADSSPQVQAGVARRFDNELTDALAMLA